MERMSFLGGDTHAGGGGGGFASVVRKSQSVVE